MQRKKTERTNEKMVKIPIRENTKGNKRDTLILKVIPSHCEKTKLVRCAQRSYVLGVTRLRRLSSELDSFQHTLSLCRNKLATLSNDLQILHCHTLVYTVSGILIYLHNSIDIFWEWKCRYNDLRADDGRKYQN